MKQIAPGVFYLPCLISNAYLVGERGGDWVVVDTGTRGSAEKIKAAARQKFGPGSRPAAIILTHGHFDHTGSARELADHWNVPIYAPRGEMPFLTGKDKYPPLDPTTGGFFAFLSRFLPRSGEDFSPRIVELPSDGTIPGMPGWECHATPGHSPGHISLFRPVDRMLIVGDAFITVDLDSMGATLVKKPEISRPPTPGTADWQAAAESVRRLAALRPYTVATGHGVPLSGTEVADQLQALADTFHGPEHGRYVPQPARADSNGLVELPPPAPDPLKWQLAGVGLAALVGVGICVALGRSDTRSGKS